MKLHLEEDSIGMSLNNYCCIEFPNAKKSFLIVPFLKVRSDSELSGSLFDEYHFIPQFYNKVSVSKRKLDKLFEYVRTLENQLSKYQEVKPLDLNSLLFIESNNEKE